MMSVFGVVPPEPPRRHDPSVLAPRFTDAMERVFGEMLRAGHDPIYGECERTDERQTYLFGFGRDYDDGRGRVTNVPHAYDGWHFFRLAVDVWDRKLLYNPSAQFLADLGRFAQMHSLRWGGDWNGNQRRDEHFIDADHVQWGPPMLVSPSPHALALYQQGGHAAVWREVGAA
jgi:hypothetical protein